MTQRGDRPQPGPAPAAPPAGEGTALWAALETLARWVRRTPPPGGISLPAMALLSRLSTDGGAGVSALARLERVSQPAMTQLVDRLEREGCVTRTPSPTDRRSVTVAITGAGTSVLASRRAVRADALDALLADAPDGDAAALSAALPALTRLAAAAAAGQQPPAPLAGDQR